MNRKRTLLFDSLILIFLAVLLIKPLFSLKYLNNWPSIESTFIADARMLSDHLPHPGWQPLWYCGTRTDYIYPPALRYGTVLIAKLGHVLPARAYHIYIAVFYVLGIAAVYGLVRIGSESRGAAWMAALATALLSPSFLLLRQIRHDSGYWVPQRLHVLMAWGEGPHISSLCVLPAALAAAFLALRKWRPATLAAAGVLCALVVATNFYGATALAIFYSIMVWSVWTGERNRRVLFRAAAIPAIAYGLSAFWLTPSYLRITAVDLKWVSQPRTSGSLIILAMIVALYCFISRRFGAGRRDWEWPLFVAGAAAVFSLYVLGFYYFGIRIAGDPARLVPELDLALILAGVEVLRYFWRWPRFRIYVALVVALGFSSSIRYLRHVWSPFPAAGPLETTYDYTTAQWVHEHLPAERVLPVGTVRLWFDAWSDNAQTDGGSDQGILNQIIPTATWQILHGDRADLAIRWLQALGTGAVVVPDKTSLEYYRDYERPEKFRGVVPVLHDDRHGTVVYQIPRVYPGIARLVDKARMKEIGPIRGGDDVETLTKYVAEIESRAHPAATVAWRGFDEADVEATVARGESILLQETWDPAWGAYENGAETTDSRGTRDGVHADRPARRRAQDTDAIRDTARKSFRPGSFLCHADHCGWPRRYAGGAHHRSMRILLYSGKGGVGKTSVAAATGVQLARLGYRTLVMSVDPAHSLADSFDLAGQLFHGDTSEPRSVAAGLWIQEVNIQREIKRHWQAISGYITSLLRTSGLGDVEAEEMAIFPGMEELSALMYVNQYRKTAQFDVVVLDCAPTAESLRFISLPTTLDWYMKHVFTFERKLLKAIRPIANRVAPVEMPPDSYFDNVRDLFGKIEGIDTVLEDSNTTSVRLVTNAEKMVLRETQRAFVYFSLHGLTVDQVVVNRLFPVEIHDEFFEKWREVQGLVVAEIEAYFAPIPVARVPLFRTEVLGIERLGELAGVLYGEIPIPAAVTRTERPYSFVRKDGTYQVRLHMPFAQKGEIGLFKKDDELIVEVGTLRRHIGLPTSMSALAPAGAHMENNVLVVEMRGSA